MFAPLLEPAPYSRKRGVGQWLALALLLAGCQRAPEKAAPPRPLLVEIRHNDGTAERLRLGTPVRIPGMLWLDFEHGARVANFLPRVPRPGAPAGAPDPDFVCADLDLDMGRWGQLMPLSGRPVTVLGITAPHPRPSPCPILLTQIEVRRR